MKFQIIPVTPFQVNCTLMWCEKTNKAAVVDPGGDLPRIVDALQKNGLTLEKVFVTHGHLDHCGGAKKLAAQAGVRRARWASTAGEKSVSRAR